ncbi:hypothetical protein [Francisella sp. SYW-9]|uniref:hypothetical protein n=1 Tax=Francisella sp. SYW-9 TaxID=2610888 RepID=UPI00168CCC80|nr:hypothetical protein [Francisella sp. SYW-9]
MVQLGCETTEGLSIGKALLKPCLVDMKLKGYAYTIIGTVGPADFYEKAVVQLK